MPRIVIKKEDLPAADLAGAVIMRFRIASDSRNAISDWSPVYHLYPPSYDDSLEEDEFYDQGGVSSISITSSKTSNDPLRYSVSVNWQDSYNLPQYDIYVRWDLGNWIYMDTTSVKTYSFDSPIDPVPAEVDIAITRATFVKSYDLGGGTRTPTTIFNTVGHSHELV